MGTCRYNVQRILGGLPVSKTIALPSRPITNDAPTHVCKICGCLWRRNHDGTWSLGSEDHAGACCDNAPDAAMTLVPWPLG